MMWTEIALRWDLLPYGIIVVKDKMYILEIFDINDLCKN